MKLNLRLQKNLQSLELIDKFNKVTSQYTKTNETKCSG